ncbi:hypothetical protein [Cryptosporangium sp. NPDC051539]|uniref:hypothetical protein n=1 Tax=Cryptosporangium sp. NPDC051539 TaxID=3363962 RepID=UPI0037896C30
MSETFNGRVAITDVSGREAFIFDSQFAVLDLGALNNEGDLRLRGDDGQTKIQLDGGRQLLLMFNAAGAPTITLDGNSGDIQLNGADCAEDFDVIDPASVGPGSVLTIGAGGRLESCQKAYDRRVAGIVSGAGGYRPGVVLDSRPGQKRTPVALSGKAFCKVDASEEPVEVGDLLTTSARTGYAMKATDPQKAFGATLGKALQPLAQGTGLIPVLVALH